MSKSIAISVLVCAAVLSILLLACSEDPSPTPTSTPLPPPTIAPTASPTPIPPTSTPIPPTATPVPSSPTPTSTPHATAADLEIDGETVWQELFDLLTVPEQSCIRDNLDAETLESMLNETILAETEYLELRHVSLFSCLSQQTAEATFASIMIAGMQESEELEFSDAELSCARGIAADADVPALVAAMMVEPEDPAVAAKMFIDILTCAPDLFISAFFAEGGVQLEDLSEDAKSCMRDKVTSFDLPDEIGGDLEAVGALLGFEWFSCIPSLFISSVTGEDVELSADEASCLRELLTDIDVSAMMATGDDLAASAELGIAMVSCVPELFLAAFLEGTGISVEDLSEDEKSCLQERLKGLDLSAFATADDSDPAILMEAMGLLSCVPDLFKATEESTPAEVPTPTPTPAPPTPAQTGVAAYVQQCEELTVPLSAAFEFDLEAGEDISWGELAAMSDAIVLAYGQLNPPSELQEYHDANLRAVEALRDHANSRPSGDSFAEEFLIILFEIIGEAFEIGFDTTKTEEERERLIEESVTQKFGEIFGPDFLDASLAAQEAGEALSDETRAVLDASDCGLTSTTSSIGEDTESIEENGEDDHADNIDGATAATLDQATTGALDYYGDIDYFVFQVEEGELYQIEVDLGTLSDSFAAVYDADGQELASNDDFGDSLASRIIWQAPGSGSYYVQVGGFGDTGTYTLTVDVADFVDDHANTTAAATAATLGDSVPGALDYDTDTDFFVFEAEEHELYQIDVALDTLAVSFATVYDADEQDLAFNDDFGDSFASRIYWEAPSSGEYYVEVGGYGDTGTYTITVDVSDIVDADTNYHIKRKTDSTLVQQYTLLTPGQPVTSALDYDGDIDFFVLEAKEGELYQIDVALGTLSDSLAVLYDANEVELAFNDDFGDSWASRIIWQAPGSGSYYVKVSGFGDTGTYSLTVDVSGVDEDHSSSDENAASFRIGVMEAVTGLIEIHGTSRVDAKQMAVDEINEAGGVNGRTLQLIVADSKCDAQEAINAYNQLTDVDGVKIILGPTCSGAMLGVAPLAEEDGVVLLSASATNPDIATAGDYIFRTALSDSQLGIDTGNLLWADGIRKLATITASTDYAEGVRRTTVAQFEKLGGEVVAGEFYASDQTDFTSELTKLISANPDAIHIAAQSEVAGGTIVKQIRELGFDGPLYTEVVTIGPMALETAGEAATGLKAVATELDPANPVAQEFVANFQNRYGYLLLTWYIGSAYDNVYIAAECLRLTNDDQDADGFRDCLYNITGSGVIGEEFIFDSQGEIVGLANAVLQVLPTNQRTTDNQGYKILGPAPTAAEAIAAHGAKIDRAALTALYNSTDGANWLNNARWLSDQPVGEWHGVTTDDDGRVKELDLQGNWLTGTIPTELDNLSNLTSLRLNDNRLTGSIPAELGNLSNLQILRLEVNDLSGEVPSTLGDLSYLVSLWLSENQLSGEIPSTLGNLDKLRHLWLNDNRLTGTIPPELGNLTRLQYLYLSDNRLTGEIPTELGNLTSLQFLWLSDNRLSGCVPRSLTSLPDLSIWTGIFGLQDC